ncbi:unnamed protein product, partial [Trichogramma brassicae]
MCGYVSMGKYSLKDVRAHIKREHEAGQAKPVRARGAARAARPNNNSNRRCRDNNNNINNSNENGSGESVNSISSQNDGATAADTIGTDRSAAPSRSAQNRREEEDGPEEDSPGPTIMRTRRAARQRLPSMSDTDDDSINTSIHEQQQQHQLARNNLSVSPDVQRHQHVTTRTQAATATSPDSGSVTPPPTPLSSRVTNANVSHSPESPRRTLRPRAAATQQPRLQTTSRAWRATSVPAESQGSQRQQRLPKRTLQPTQESAEGRRSTTSTATQRAAPSTTSRQQRSTSPTALARRSGSTRSSANSSASASTSRKSGSSPPAVRTTRAERLSVPGHWDWNHVIRSVVTSAASLLPPEPFIDYATQYQQRSTLDSFEARGPSRSCAMRHDRQMTTVYRYCADNLSLVMCARSQRPTTQRTGSARGSG